jgi:inner membrane protein
LGNRAMLWGAVGGTIPDLDVLAALFTDEITSTSFHRGIMHSFLFAALAPFVLARMVQWFYGNQHYRRKTYKRSAMVIWLLFYVGAATGINFIPVLMGEGLSWYILTPTLLLGAWFAIRLWRDYLNRDLQLVEASYRTWVALFFWSIFTHPILDCFTNWGTQIWQPFSDLRVQWSTVSVVDPLYTLPFAALLILASRFSRSHTLRTVLTWAGILWGCAYLGYTVWHKQTAQRILETSLQEKNLTWKRRSAMPSIFNNIAWYGVAEADSVFYFGMYSFNDRIPRFSPISTLPKNHELLAPVPYDSRAYTFLRWFTDGYYNVVPYRGDTLQVNDLRFGLLGDTLLDNNYVFPFLLFKNEKGEWDVVQNNRNQASVEASKKSFGKLWERVKGR